MTIKLIDGFTFNKEFDLLELRLQEHWDHVDQFVIVEANTTFTNTPKPFYLAENWERFKPYADKITHIMVSDMPGNSDPWVQEAFQRNAITRGLTNASDSDAVMIGDCDEIWRDTALKYMRHSNHQIWCQRAPEFYFKLNYMKINANLYDVWSSACRAALLKGTSPDTFRRTRLQTCHMPYNFKNNDICMLQHAGWHFSWLGDREWALDKLASWSHQEWSGADTQAILDPEQLIAQRKSFHPGGHDRWEIVDVDEYMPKTVQANIDKYSKWILPDSVGSARKFLPLNG